MAKSLRSKWRRKMKAIKRERYGKKELERLKKVIEGSKKEGSNEIDMTDLQALVNVVSYPGKSNTEDENVDENEMDVDQKVKLYDPATLRDQFGNLPVWIGSHKKKKIIKQQRKQNKIKKKKLKVKHRK
ncbi:hypothetical protein O3M35_001985 [Rhynocoris fuscipes]|uniref:Protein LLP homolog n=1 Tax=Rhynocoris fuscipes TaxID=488301 RepID=A0AAW1CT35_9HEMI